MCAATFARHWASFQAFRFDSWRDGPKAGVIAKFNQKSITVLTDDGHRYEIRR